MFETIYNFFAIIFGYIMNFFYLILDFVGLPYLWLCIILFAATTRLIFLPQKFGSMRKSILAPAINYDVRQLRKKYGSISKDDKERVKQYKNDVNAINKKYRVSSGSGCLMFFLQLPIYVGLFYVIKDPFKYVPQLSSLTEIEKINVNNFFGLSLESLPKDFGAYGIIIPLIVFLGFILRLMPSFLGKGKKVQPYVLIISILQVFFITWMSFCFPIAISLYWIVNEFTNLALDKFVKESLNKNPQIRMILNKTTILISEEREKEREAKEQFEASKGSEGSEPASSNILDVQNSNNSVCNI